MSDPDRIKALFLEAMDLPDAAARRRFVLDRAADDPRTRELVLELLEADGRPGVLDGDGPGRPPDAGIHLPSSGTPPIPATIGRYRLLHLLGEGGMGRVFAAIGLDGERVAIKLLRGDASRESAARFRREITLLQGLDHPSISRVLDAGLHLDGLTGRPWYAMQLVLGGRTIGAWAAEQPRVPAAVARLVAAVADGVAHAHERGVIHRDLKLSNILVDERDLPRIIDFGVAGTQAIGPGTLASAFALAPSPAPAAAPATAPAPAPATAIGGLAASRLVHTRTGQLLGTMTSIPPERFDDTLGATGERRPPDVRGDVYGLGLVLYELLTGHLPWAVDAVPTWEIPRLIRETPPRRPSATRPILRGDLDSIVLTAIERDPARRYASAAALAEDLRRWLAGDSLTARRDHALQTLRRRLGRHRVTLALCSVLILALSATAVLLGRELQETNRQHATLLRQEAQTALRHASDAVDAGDGLEARRLLQASASLRDTWGWRHFDARTREAMAAPRVLVGGSVRLARFCPSSRRLAIVDDANTLEVIDVLDGSRIQTVGTLPADRHATDARWSPDGSYLALVLDDGGTHIMAVPTGGALPALRTLPASVSLGEAARRMSSQLHFLAHGGMLEVDVEGRLRGRPGGEHAASGWTRQAGSPGPPRVLVGPQGRRIALVDSAGTLALLDADTGTPRWERPDAYRTSPVSMRFSPDGRSLHVGTRHGRLDDWDVDAGDVRRTVTLPMSVDSLAVSADGRRIACGDARTVHVRDALTGSALGILSSEGHEVLALTFEPGGDRLLAFHGNGELRRWELGDHSAVRIVDEAGATAIDGLRWSPDGSRLAVTRRCGRLDLLDPRNAGGTGGAARFELGAGRAWEPRFNRDGTLLAALVQDHPHHHVAVWSCPALSLVARFDVDGQGRGIAWLPGEGPGALLVARTDGSVSLLDVAEGEVRTMHEPGAGPLGDMEVHEVLSLHPGTCRLALGAFDGRVAVVDLVREDQATADWRLADPRVLTGHAAAVQRAEFSGDGTQLATGDGAGGVRLWDAVRGVARGRLHRTGGDLITGLAWLDGGEQLAVAGFDSPIALYEAATGRKLLALSGTVRRLDLRPGGGVIATVDRSDDSWLRLHADRAGRDARSPRPGTLAIAD